MKMRLPAPNRPPRRVALLLGLAPAILMAAAGIPPGKAVITLTPKFGPVTFAHRRHSDLEGVSCVTCHHRMHDSGEQIRSCDSCHAARLFRIAAVRKVEPGNVEDTGPQVRDAQEAFHGLCTSCHRRRRNNGRAAGPDDSCRDCHR